MVQVLINRSDTTLLVQTNNVGTIRNRFFENVFFQFLIVPMKEGADFFSSLNNTIDEIEKELLHRQQVIEQQRIEEERLSQFDPRGIKLLWLFAIIAAIFGLTFQIKRRRTTNIHEVRSFYGLSRLPLWVSVLLGAVVFIGGSYLILQHIGFGSGVVTFVF